MFIARTKQRTNFFLTLSRPRPISYGNQSIDLHFKSMDWFLYDIDVGRERVNVLSFILTCSWFHLLIFNYILITSFKKNTFKGLISKKGTSTENFMRADAPSVLSGAGPMFITFKCCNYSWHYVPFGNWLHISKYHGRPNEI